MKWLFLVHQVKTPNSRERVRVWRMTKKVGAILYRNSAYVLPYSKERLEDFQWLAQQIRDSKGEASIFVSESQDKQEDELLRNLFSVAKKNEYAALLKSIASMKMRARQSERTRLSAPTARQVTKRVKQLQEEYASVHQTDFFHHPLAASVPPALKALADSMTSMTPPHPQPAKVTRHVRKDFQRKTWSTREHIHIDRLCSAWLIRRFIDTKAKFVFAHESRLPKNTIPFDVLGAEFSHRGEDCTFETLLKSFQLKDKALAHIAEIVHDIDMKDNKFARAEAAGIDVMVRSLSDHLRNDENVLAAGSPFLDALYQRFSTTRGKR